RVGFHLTIKGRVPFHVFANSGLSGHIEVGTSVSRVPPFLVHKLTWMFSRLLVDSNRDDSSLVLPAGLQELTFGGWFDQSVDKMVWPAGLQQLTFGFAFDQSVDEVVWPAGLQQLT
ncbi:unnamed protein product, partial [Discosporangium mesarthrocarpum]